MWFLGKWSHPRPGVPGVLSLGGGGAWPGPGPPGGSRLARPPVPLPICLSGEWGEPGWSVAGSDGSSKTTDPKTVAPDRNGGLLIS